MRNRFKQEMKGRDMDAKPIMIGLAALVVLIALGALLGWLFLSQGPETSPFSSTTTIPQASDVSAANDISSALEDEIASMTGDQLAALDSDMSDFSAYADDIITGYSASYFYQ